MLLGCDDMKKGFTLAELIGVLVVLALIGMIAVPSVAQSIKENKQKICVIQFSNITEATKSWAANNIEKLPRSVTFNELINSGDLEDNLKNPKTGESFSNEWRVKIEKVNSGFQYKIYSSNDESSFVDPQKYCS